MSIELRQKIEAFNIDGPDTPALPYAVRLARENGWTRAYTARVVREYKRFLYLAVTAPHAASPSEAVDAAWHLHLTYTRSYWQRLCQETLGRPLHHEPTRGGHDEGAKYRNLYERTLQTYRDTLGEDPPGDIWPPADVRFGEDLRHVTVNTARNWVVPKAVVRRAVGVLAVVTFAFVFATGCVGGLNPFDLKGTEYLAFFVPLLVAGLIVSLVIRNRLRGPGFDAGEEKPSLTWQHAAYLRANHRGLASATIAKLVQANAAAVSADGKTVAVVGRLPENATDIERAVYDVLPLKNDDPPSLKRLAEAVQLAWQSEKDAFEEAGLSFSPSARFGNALVYTLPYLFVVAAFGVTRLAMGLMNDKPSGFLVATLIGSVIVLILLAATSPRRTRKADEVLADATRANGRLRKNFTPTTADDAALAVALFGTIALAGTQYETLKQWYPASPTSGSGGCGAGCGGGGGCGGGCGGGGCGGCS
ncbi:TIGR04222 domain-containing membrane protein [Limnoglobus roseus]|uniref:TIGR04222 domain-containing membrane protein n=1 Tax=Limnoglobus roseus TaxID=2598579 RepID=A0A5C1A7E7_9BACT|nr:TIGR04222 domain-containing membrane protein [Limnoglobus roseus]QEL14385.1 TIGR04222 domain-containing membrane protein [Limnoglobus roseus]